MLALLHDNIDTNHLSVAHKFHLAFSRRGLAIKTRLSLNHQPHLFFKFPGKQIYNIERHCFWELSDRRILPDEISSSRWFWHQGLLRSQYESLRDRVILVPWPDLFAIRNLQPSRKAYRLYRLATALPWERKEAKVYFIGQNSGLWHQSRLRACQLLADVIAIPSVLGLCSGPTPQHAVPPEFHSDVRLPYEIGRYRYLLSLWGNHPFNPRLFRGLETGALVFHQEAPDIVDLHSRFFKPYEHYVPLQPDLSDLLEKLDYYLTHQTEARQIAEQGQHFWQANFQISEPYQIPELIWQSFVQQPEIQRFRAEFDVH
ncbi:MAG: glycosyl transferase family 90 [Cyanobacteria bacterium P01_H01_bin.15]